MNCAESYLIKYLATAVKRLNGRYPGIHYHITSGDTSIVAEHLDRGLIDMAFIAKPHDLSEYVYLGIPESDTWGVLIYVQGLSAGAKFRNLTGRFDPVFHLLLGTIHKGRPVGKK
ncbi:LysR substrate-binding domain-containing protein [Muricomes sp. OA1]|uniref:LysR substrate-binding domain-containing protein n=1 Tax=Muricomes sp. OA1 TaxID=2914165 RepID=UPI003FA54D5B